MLKSCQNEKLDILCSSVRELCTKKNYDECCILILEAMKNFPSAAEPHNLLGIIFEKTGNHSDAMKHFRAAWALDPTYRPAAHNLHTYGTFFSHGKCAFDESDLEETSVCRNSGEQHMKNSDIGEKNEYFKI